jgi:hypothetical protein
MEIFFEMSQAVWEESTVLNYLTLINQKLGWNLVTTGFYNC